MDDAGVTGSVIRPWVVTWASDESGRIVQVDGAWAVMTGQPPASELGDGWQAHLHPDDLQAVNDTFRSALAAQAAFRTGGRVRLADGSYRHVMSAGHPRFDAAGAFRGYYGTLVDDDDSYRAEEALQRSEENYRRLLDKLDEGFVVYEPIFDGAGNAVDLLVRQVNSAFAVHAGRALAPGQRYLDVFPSLSPRVLAACADAMRTGVAQRLEAFGENSTGRWFDIFMMRMGGEGSRLIACVFNDISARKKLELEQRASERRQEFLLRLNDVLWPLSDTGAIEAEACRVLAEHLGASRVIYSEIDADGRASETVQHVQGIGRIARPSQPRDYNDTAMAKYLRGEAIICNDTMAAPGLSAAQRQRFAEESVAAIAGVPVMKRGQLAGRLVVHHAAAHAWSAGELELIGETAERIWAAADRARTEAALRESERDLRLAQAVSQTGSWRDDYVTGECVWSAETCRMFGLPEETPKSLEMFFGLVHPDDRAIAALPHPDDKPASKFDIEYRITVRGETRWIRERGQYVFDGDGNVLRGFGTVQDVTDRKADAEALDETRARQAFLLRLSDAIRPLSDPQQVQLEACRVLGQYLRASRVFFAETDEEGVSASGPQYLSGVGPALSHWRLDDFEHGLLERFRAGETVVCCDVATAPQLTADQKRNHDSEKIGARVTVPLLKDGKLAGRLLVHQTTPRQWTQAEISLMQDTADRLWSSIKRSRAEDALRRSEEDLRRAQAVAGVGSWRADFRTGVLIWSAETRRIFGVPEPRHIDYAFFLSCVHPEDRHLVDLDAGGVALMSPFDLEYRIVVDGAVRWVLERGDINFDAEGKPLDGFGTVQDITGRKAVEQSLRENQRRQGLLLRLGDTLRELADPGQIKREACRVLGEELGASRVLYVEVSEAGFSAGGTEFVRGVSPMPERWRLGDFDPRLHDALRAGERVWRSDVAADAALTAGQKAAHAALEIGAWAAVPLGKQGAQVSRVAVHFRDPHRWTEAEIALIEETAERISPAVDRARVEARLVKSEADLQGAQSIGKIGSWRINVQREEIYWSPETCRIFGVPEDVPKRYGLFMSVVHPDDRNRVDEEWRAATRGASYESEYRIVVRGEVRSVSERGEIERDSDGSVIAVFGTTQDVTEQKAAEALLRESEEQKSYLLKLTDALRPIADPLEKQRLACRVLGEFLGASQVFFTLGNETGAADSGPQYRDGVPPVRPGRRLAEFEGGLLELYNRGQTVVRNDIAGDPALTVQEKAVHAAEHIAARVSVPLIKAGAMVGRLVVHQNRPRSWTRAEVAVIEETAERLWASVERTKAEDALRQSEAALRRAQTVSRTGSWVHDYNTGELTWSAEACRIFGTREGEPLRIEKFLELVHPDDRYLVDISLPGATFETPFDIEYRVIIDGELRWVRERGEIEFDASGRPLRDFGAVQEFTDRKLVEQALAESEERHAYLLKLSDSLRSASSPEDIQEEACRLLGQHLGASRAFVAMIDEAGANIDGPQYLDGVPAAKPRWAFSEFTTQAKRNYLEGQTIAYADFAADAAIPAAQRAALAAEHIAAAVSAPLPRGGRLVARLVVHQSKPRAWTKSEIALLEESADRLWGALERARAEAALRASERELKRAQAVARTGSWSYDYDREVIDWSAETCRIFGVPEGTRCHYDQFRTYVHPDDYDRLRKVSLRRSVENAYEVDYRIMVEGCVRWVRERGEVERGADGVAWCEYGTLQDISERKATEQALQDSEARHAFLLKLSDALRMLADPREIQVEGCRVLGRHLGANRVVYAESDDAGKSLTCAEYVAGVVPSTPVWDVSEYDSNLLEKYHRGQVLWSDDVASQRGLSDRQRSNYAAEQIGSWAAAPLLKEGHLVGRLIVNLETAHGWLPAEIAIIQETAERLWAASERARAETALRDSEQELSRAQAVGRIGSFRGNYDTGELIWSAETRRIFGVPPDRAMDMTAFLAIVHPDDLTIAQTVPSANSMGKFFEVDYRIVVNGETLWVRERGEYEFDGGRLVAGFGTVQDITERKRIEQALHASEERQAYMLRLSDALRPLGDPLEIQAEACRVLGRHLRANRVFYGETDAEGGVLVGPQYVDGVPRAERHIPSHRMPQTLVEQYRQGRPVVDNDIASNPDLSEQEKRINAGASIGARVAVPLIKDGVPVARLVVQQAMARAWTEWEVDLIAETADRTWSALERARAQAALRESEAVFRALGESVPSFLWMTDPMGEPVYVNPACSRYTGKNLAETGGTWRDIYHPDDLPALELQWAKSLAVGEALQFEARIRRLDRVYRWFAVQLVPSRDGFGRIVRWVGTANDVDDRKRRERNTALLTELQDDMARFVSTDDIMAVVGAKLAAFLNVSVGYLADADGDMRGMTLLNQLANRRLPEFPSRFVFADHVAPEIVRAWNNGYATAVNDTGMDQRVNAKAFAALGVGAAVIVPFVRGGFLNALMVVHDARPRLWSDDEVELFRELANRLFPRLERARAEQALRESEAVFRTIGESLPDMLWLSESDGTVIYENEVATAFTGVSLLGAPPGHWTDSYHPDDVAELAAHWARALAEGEALHYEARRRRHDGTYRWFAGRTVPARNESGHIVRWVGTMTDIDDRKRREEQAGLLAEIQDDLARLADVDEIMKTVGAKLGGYLGASISYLTNVEGAGGRLALDVHVPSGAMPAMPKDCALADFMSADATAALRDGALVVIGDTATDLRAEAAQCAACGIGAIAWVPFLRSGVLNALMTADAAHARQWREDEVDLMREVAYRVFPRVERARAEAASRESEAIFRTMGEAVPDFLWMSDAAGRLIYNSPSALAFLGVDQEAIKCEGLESYFYEEDRPGVVATMGEAMRSESATYFEARVRRHDGVYLWLACRAAPAKDEAGRIVRWVGAMTDIDALRRRERHASFLAEIQDDLVRTVAAEEIMKSVGERLAAFLGVSVGYLVDIDPGDDRMDLSGHVGSKAREEYPENYVVLDYVSPEVVKAWGEDRMLVVGDTQDDPAANAVAFAGIGIMAIVGVPYLRNGVLDALMVVHDVTPRAWAADELELIRDVADRLFPRVERARAETALRQSEERFRQVFEYSATGISITDLEGRLLRCNPAYCRLMGYDESEIAGMNFMDMVHPDDREANRLETDWLLAGKMPNFDFDFRYVRKDGSVVWAEKVVSLLRDESGAAVNMVALVTDVTERRRTMEDLREADRRKDEFIATVAHELRNPLVPIHNGVHILRSIASGKTAAPSGKLLDMMDRQVAHLVRLVDDLVEISRVTRGKIELRRELVDLAAVIRGACETCQPLVAAKQHSLLVELPEEPLVLDADPVRLVQVFSNLLNNAVKFTGTGGNISIGVERQGGWAFVVMRDNGIGIPAEILPRVFDLFVQDHHSAIRSGGGLGIGLALVRNLVEMHGGTVEARSPGRDRGSEFIVRLPLAMAPDGKEHHQ